MPCMRTPLISCHDKDNMKRFIVGIVRHLFRRKKRLQPEAEFLGYEAFSESTAAAIKKAGSLSGPAKVRRQKAW
jgi:hypothetical protein